MNYRLNIQRSDSTFNTYGACYGTPLNLTHGTLIFETFRIPSAHSKDLTMRWSLLQMSTTIFNFTKVLKTRLSLQVEASQASYCPTVGLAFTVLNYEQDNSLITLHQKGPIPTPDIPYGSRVFQSTTFSPEEFPVGSGCAFGQKFPEPTAKIVPLNKSGKYEVDLGTVMNFSTVDQFKRYVLIAVAPVGDSFGGWPCYPNYVVQPSSVSLDVTYE